jgi:hypothetical protein
LIENWDEIAREVAAADRRKKDRVHLGFRIEISVRGADGRLLTERTKTVDISEHGCRIATRLPLKPGDKLTVALVRPYSQNSGQENVRQFEVMWIADEAKVRVAGIRQIEGDSLWDVSFPPIRVHEKSND